MSPERVTKIITMSTMLLLCVLVKSEAKETSLSMYLHDVAAGPNATTVPVAGVPGKTPSFTQFGTLYVTDDVATETPNPRSARIGRVQGMYVTSALDGSNTHVSVSIMFTNNEYNGSTLEIQGTSKQFEPVREVPVVAGTGKFRYASGYVTFETYFEDMATSSSIIRCNVSVLHEGRNL